MSGKRGVSSNFSKIQLILTQLKWEIINFPHILPGKGLLICLVRVHFLILGLPLTQKFLLLRKLGKILQFQRQ